MIIRTLYCDMNKRDVTKKWSNVKPTAEEMRSHIFRERPYQWHHGKRKWAKAETPQLRTYSWTATSSLRQVFEDLGLCDEMPCIKRTTIIDLVFSRNKVQGTHTNDVLGAVRRAVMPYSVSGDGILIFTIPEDK